MRYARCSERGTTPWCSTTYAREIQTKENGAGLDPVLKHRADRLLGILNGVDTTQWNPAGDPGKFCHSTHVRVPFRCFLTECAQCPGNPDPAAEK